MRAPAFTASSTWRCRFLRSSGRASGPSLVPSFMGSPIGSAFDCSTNALVKSSNRGSATRKRLAQMQPSLLLKKRDATPSCTAFARSASPRTMNGSEPPSSSTTLLPTRAASSATARPARTLPVTVAARIGDDGRTRLNLDCKVDIKSFGATGVAHQGLQRLGAALDRFGVLHDRGIADKGCGVEETQHLPEGYVPRLNGEDRPYRFIDDLCRYAGDRLWLEISLPRFGEVAGGPGGFLDLENGVRQRIAHLGGD